MWQQYSQGIQARNLVQLDYLVSRRAFKAGQSQKDIARMLLVASAYVRQLEQLQSKEKVKHYVSQTVRAACGQGQEKPLNRQRQQLELES